MAGPYAVDAQRLEARHLYRANRAAGIYHGAPGSAALGGGTVAGAGDPPGACGGPGAVRGGAGTAPSAAARGTPPSAAARGAAPSAMVGSIYVDSRPRGARVMLDGRPSAYTPVRVPDVRIGSHVVRLELPDHRCLVRQHARHRGQEQRGHRFARTHSMKAILALENGIWYEGEAAGAPDETGGEVVFNTSMTGYQEVLTDPSYAGQIVTMTCPEIGNYGVSRRGRRVARPQVAGFIVRDESPMASNWRSEQHAARLPRPPQHRRISDIDTRALTRVLRSAGVMRGVIATGDVDPRELVEKARALPPMEGSRPGARRHLRRAVRLDAGAVRRVRAARRERQAGAAAARRRLRLRHEVEHPAPLHRARLRRARVSRRRRRRPSCWRRSPDGVFLSNGPGDPGGARLRDRQRARAGRGGRADVRHLPRPSDPRRWRWAARPTS